MVMAKDTFHWGSVIHLCPGMTKPFVGKILDIGNGSGMISWSVGELNLGYCPNCGVRLPSSISSRILKDTDVLDAYWREVDPDYSPELP